MSVEIPQQIPLGETEFTMSLITGDSGERLYDLYLSVKDDERVLAEFGSTVDAYIQSREIAIERAKQIYSTQPSAERLGYLILEASIDRPVGMAIIGVLEKTIHTTDGEIVQFPGVNFSGWFCSDVRNNQIGTLASVPITTIARNLIHDDSPDNPEWKNRILYTGINRGNLASQRVVSKLGFQAMGNLEDLPDYDAWMLPSDWNEFLANQ